MKLISIIIPVYNREKTIIHAIESVKQQTYQNTEIIVVNDGSTDNTSQIVKNLAKEDSMIVYLEHPNNKGAQAARNTGIKAAKGEWIAFLDSDDQWLVDSLEKRLFLAQKEKVKVVYSECYVIRQKNEAMKLYGIPPMTGDIYQNILSHPSPMFQSLLIAKDALEKIDYLDEKIISYQEWDTSIRLAKYYPFAFFAEPTFIYNCQGDDTISKNMIKGAEGYQQVIDKHKNEILRVAGFQSLARHYWFLSSNYTLANRLAKAFFYKILSLVLEPKQLLTRSKSILSLFLHKVFILLAEIKNQA